MRSFRPSCLTKLFYRDAVFRIKKAENVLYLTFDDGPHPESIFPLLRILSDYSIKAVFFCSGRTASDNPDLIKSIKSAGHIIGNHGFDHLDGLVTTTDKYLDDIKKASYLTSEYLFRPPFGRMKLSQYSFLKKKYKIIMWDIMPYDFDLEFGAVKSVSVLKKLMRPGSVIVLHDKRESNLLEFIEEFIVQAKKEGYRFELLPDIYVK